MRNLNPYKITWAFLIPTSGIATQKDSNSSFQRGAFKSYLAGFSNNKESALKKVKDLKGGLSKEYQVLCITDKQFAMLQFNYKNNSHNLMDIATTKQKLEMFAIK